MIVSFDHAAHRRQIDRRALLGQVADRPRSLSRSWSRVAAALASQGSSVWKMPAI